MSPMNISLVVSTFSHRINCVGKKDNANYSCSVVNDSGVYLPVSSTNTDEDTCVDTMILIVTSLHRQKRRASGQDHPLPMRHPITEAC